MKKKYYFIVLFIVLITSSLFILLGKGGTNPQVVVDAFESEWGIQIPAPDIEAPIYTAELPEAGKGQWAIIYSYEEKQNLSASKMEKLDADMLEQYAEKIEAFEKEIIENSPSKEKEITKAFNENEPKLEVGDYGFYSEKNAGKDYFLAVYHNKELYTYTYHK